MLQRTLRPTAALRVPLLLFSRRTLATPASSSSESVASEEPSTSSSSSSTLPPLIDQALRRSPVLSKLVDDDLFCRSFRTTAETMYNNGLNGEESIGQKFSQLFSSSPTLQTAIAEMRASTGRMGISDEDFQPVLAALFAKGGLQPFAPTSSSSSPPAEENGQTENKEEKKGCGHNHAPGEKCS